MMNVNSKPAVSVVIPSYNRGYCIEECIRSVQAQSYANLEIIIVDDASSDDTRLRVAAIADPRLRYVAHEHNRGGAAARNTGICCAGGEYIAFLDSDDRWTPDKLEKQVHGLLARGEEYGLSYTWLLYVDANDEEVMRTSPELEGDCRRDILVSNFVGSFSSVIIRRDLLALVGGLDEAMRSCQDWDLFIRLLRVTKVHCLREYLVRYRRSGGDEVRISLNPRAVVQGHRRILRKFAAEYRALPHEQRRAALRWHFNAFAGVGAFGQAARTGGAILFQRAGPAEWLRLLRGLVRAAKNAVWRMRKKWRLQHPRIGSVPR